MLRKLLARQNVAFDPSTLDPVYRAETKVPQILTIQGVLFALSSAVVLLRVYVRVFMLNGLSIDDYVMLSAALCSVGTMTTFVGETYHGLGRHFLAIDMEDFPTFGKYIFFNAIFLVTGISLVKISLGFFLLRVAQHSRWRKFIIFMIAFLVLFTLASLGTLIFQCLPVAAAWDMNLRPTAKCLTPNTYLHIGIFNSSVNIATDVIFATIPIPMFFKIQVKMRRKIILMVILGLGYFACGAAVAKLVLQTSFNKNKDPTWNTDYYTWNGVEFQVGILTTCLPTLRPLFKSLYDGSKAFTSRRSRSRPTNGYYMQDDSNLPLSSYGNNRASIIRDKYNVRVSARGSNVIGDDAGNDGDNWDRDTVNEYNLSDSSGRKGSARIMRTTEISVLSDANADARSLATSEGTSRLGPQRRATEQL
ncbi:hypothetical protein AJ79_00193 [Helicocarpus griseus UAMH5409]|uniref:Rhodopsin domain-containing protein n=1 Tax=Helicocarpus griseus UAMH5409 TaxID=1447875 RepID=A0A2B7YC51_9EURO|nr:hypothetical protein AJ79_00193 [Helicocarpus griseus UAMH5409]